MGEKKPVYFDLETVSLLRDALDDAWACLRPQERATMSRTQLAEGILALAAEGERNPDRLIDAALMAPVVCVTLPPPRSMARWPLSPTKSYSSARLISTRR